MFTLAIVYVYVVNYNKGTVKNPDDATEISETRCFLCDGLVYTKVTASVTSLLSGHYLCLDKHRGRCGVSQGSLLAALGVWDRSITKGSLQLLQSHPQ